MQAGINSGAGKISVVGDLDNLVEFLPKALEFVGINVSLLAVGVELFLGRPPEILQKIYV